MASRVLMWGARRAAGLYHTLVQQQPAGPAAAAARELSSIAAHSDDVEAEILDHFIDSPQAHAIAFFFALVAFVISTYLLYKHLQYYTRPLLQRQVVRIVFIIPVYAVCSALSLGFEAYAHHINTVRDVYEAYCIHCFLVLMLDFPGGEAAVVEGIKDKGLMAHPAPFSACCPRIPLGADFIKNMKRTTLQFVVLKPLMAALSLVAMWGGFFNTDPVQYFLLVVYNISYTTALYGLFLFYLGTKSLLYGFSPVGKFSAVKVIVFATYYQSLLVVMVPGMDDLGGSEKWNDWIICFEMALFAVMHWYCFPYTEFLPGGVGVRDLRSQGFDEPMNMRLDTSWPAVRARIGDVCNLQDTWEDLQRLFSRSGTDHIMLGTDGGIVAENTAQVVMDQEAAAAAAARAGGAPLQAPPVPLSSVRVEQEGDADTDKEGLFTGSSGGRVLAKMAQGVERLAAGLRGGGGAGDKGASAGGEDLYGSISLEGGVAPVLPVAASAAAAEVSAAAAPAAARCAPPPLPRCPSFHRPFCLFPHTHTRTHARLPPPPPPHSTPATAGAGGHWHLQGRQRPQ